MHRLIIIKKFTFAKLLKYTLKLVNDAHIIANTTNILSRKQVVYLAMPITLFSVSSSSKKGTYFFSKSVGPKYYIHLKTRVLFYFKCFSFRKRLPSIKVSDQQPFINYI